MGSAVFKPYVQDQGKLLPPRLEDLIAPDHPVRVVNAVIDSLDLSLLTSRYEGGGTSSYHPAMLLKVTVYGYLRNIYSTRRLEEALSENIHFMWLAGDARPDHNTLARFRSQRLKTSLRSVFSQVVHLLVDKGMVSLEESYLDGTKMESSAGRYTFVWGRAIQTNRAKMEARLNELLDYAEELSGKELGMEPVSFERVSSEEAAKVAGEISRVLKEHGAPAPMRAKARHLAKTTQATLDRWDAQEEILGSRNSYSKTDPDATFMRMKEDHMGNGQLKPGYNVQISTNNQCVLHYSVHPNPTDTRTLSSHLAGFQEQLGRLPCELVADAGYGSLENLEHLDSLGVAAFVKDNGFHLHVQGKDRFDSRTWPLDQASKTLICPAGRAMVLQSERKDGTLVFGQTGCQDCPLRKECCKGKGERTATRNLNHDLLRTQARERLKSPEGIQKRKKRCIEPESVFANIKQNQGFRRLRLRGSECVEIELGLVFLAQNLRKLAA